MERWSGAQLFPHWRDLQPLLIRSAGVVGVVTVVMAVASSGGMRLGDEVREPSVVGSDTADAHPPAIIPVSAFDASREDVAAAVPVPAALKSAAVAKRAEIASAADPASPAADEPLPGPEVSGDVTLASLRPDAVVPVEPAPAPAEFEPAASAASAPADVEPAALVAAPASSPAPADAYEIAKLRAEAQSPPVASAAEQMASLDPVATSAVVEAPAAAAPIVPDLRAGIASPSPATDTVSGPLTTASVREYERADAMALAMIASDASDDPSSASEMRLASLPPLEASATGFESGAREDSGFVWPEGAEICPRDWVAGAAENRDTAGDCTATEDLIASIEADSPELQHAAAALASEFAIVPRIPLPRPDPPADFAPQKRQATRVSNRATSWPEAPPPNCGAGQHAKWHFTNRKTWTKEWYCR